MNLATNYCPYCNREIPQFPTGSRKKEYCYDDCPEGEGRRITILPKKPVPVAKQKKDYTPGLGAFRDPAELLGEKFKQRRKR